MARHSAEERSASFYRALKLPATPPRGMAADARALWREIVGAKPPDWFDAASLQLLRLHCETLASANRIAKDLRQFVSGSVEHRRACQVWKMYSTQVMASARALRLTVQHAVDTESAKVTEQSSVTPINDRLLGGREAA
jgi:hypothetical protein